MNWIKFDADKPNPNTINRIKDIGKTILITERVQVTEIISLYNSNLKPDLNQVIEINIFKPSEFDNNTINDNSLKTFGSWLLTQNINWKKGSENLKKAIDNNFKQIEGKVIKGGRAKVILDNLIEVGNKKVAIEIETSTNIENGYFTLKQAIKTKRADYGIMIVPWFPISSGRADEGKATDRLDREFDGKTDLIEGPIFRISPIRKIDAVIQLTK